MNVSKKKFSPLVSIIVPVYNVAPYLQKALDSLLGQTLQNIEVICVDDKSEDNSLSLLRTYEKKDGRIKVLALDVNQGVSVARNEGMKMARGEYLGFLDPDDTVDLDFFENLWTRAAATGADIVKGLRKVIPSFGEAELSRLSSEEFSKKIAQNKMYFSYEFSVAIFKRSFLEKHKIDFPRGIIVCEEIVFLLKAILLTNRVEVVSDKSYYYLFRREGSLNSVMWNDAKIKSSVLACNMMVDFIRDANLDLESYVIGFQDQMTRLLDYVFYKSSSPQMKQFIISHSIEIYSRCKYPNEYAKTYPFYAEHLKGLLTKK